VPPATHFLTHVGRAMRYSRSPWTTSARVVLSCHARAADPSGSERGVTP